MPLAEPFVILKTSTSLSGNLLDGVSIGKGGKAKGRVEVPEDSILVEKTVLEDLRTEKSSKVVSKIKEILQAEGEDMELQEEPRPKKKKVLHQQNRSRRSDIPIIHNIHLQFIYKYGYMYH